MPVYPAPPNARMAWHEDGTQLVFLPSLTPTAQTPTKRQQVNSEENWGEEDLYVNPDTFVALVFPQKRDITHTYISNASSGFVRNVVVLQSSPDTTNGLDGTWTTVDAAHTIHTGSISDTYRTDIQANTMTNVAGIRYGVLDSGGSASLRVTHFHIYGTLHAGETPDRLELWHPTVDAPLSNYPAQFDFGDVGQNVSVTRTFRVKNLASTLTATGINVTFNVLYDPSGDYAAAHSFSGDNSTFASSLSLANLAPGGISPVSYLKFTAASDQALSVWTGYVKAAATSWT